MAKLTSAGLLLILLVTGTDSCCRGDDAVPSFDVTLKNLSSSERQLKNLHVDGVDRYEAREVDGNWKDMPECSDVTAFLNGMAGGQAAIMVRRQVTPWTGDNVPSPFLEESYIATWDGKAGTWVEFKTGGLGHAQTIPRSEISSKPPGLLYGSDYAWGAGFSNFFFQAGQSKSLSQWIGDRAEEARKFPDSICKVEIDRIDGFTLFCITVARPKLVRFDWWVDPKRGYALLRDEYHVYRPDGQIVDAGTFHDEILKLEEAAPGVWYPSEAFAYLRPGDSSVVDKHENRMIRIHYKASSVVANDPKFDPKVFEGSIPNGYAVFDKDAGKTNIAGPSTRELDSDLDAAAEEAKKAAKSDGKN